MSHKSTEIYDLNSTELEIAQWRAKRRVQLRQQYLNEMHNPNTTADGHVFDPQVQRLYSTHMAKEHLFVPKWKNFWHLIGGFTVFFLFHNYVVKPEKMAKEHRFRTGQVSYRDREWKFV